MYDIMKKLQIVEGFPGDGIDTQAPPIPITEPIPIPTIEMDGANDKTANELLGKQKRIDDASTELYNISSKLIEARNQPASTTSSLKITALTDEVVAAEAKLLMVSTDIKVATGISKNTNLIIEPSPTNVLPITSSPQVNAAPVPVNAVSTTPIKSVSQ
jgi:hypothetical protein